MTYKWFPLLCLGAFLWLACPAPGAADPMDYNRDVRPIFNRHCLKCHGGVSKKGGFSLLFEEEALAPADSGEPAIRPGHPEQSELIRRLTTEDVDDRMPSEGAPLAASDIATIRAWIQQGAPWQKHWAYRPIPEPGPARDLDALVQANLDAQHLAFSEPADRATWLRRVTLDLTGLPPTASEVQAFASDTSPDAYANVVERLLASPRYGERWAALWLDLARYADTQGYEKDNHRDIWAYRDWVIRAFNSDLPIDQFTIQQLAGDLLPDAGDAERVPTGFHRNTMTNTEGGTDNEEFRVAALIDRVNTTWEVWMGTSFGCVQCHSHPYDPFRHDEYYRFMAFLNNTADADLDNDVPRLELFTPQQKRQREGLEQRIATLRSRLTSLNPDEEAAFVRWQQDLSRMADPSWTVLQPARAEALEKVELKALPDGSLLATGPNPEVNTYTLAFDWPGEPITGFRLEALTDDSLADKGPGRAFNGNFVVSELEVFAGETRVPLQNATADFEQGDVGHLTPYGKWNAASAIDQDRFDPTAGWAIGGQLSKPHVLTVETEGDLEATSLKVVLKQNHGNRGHTLGRFRLSATTSPRPFRSDLAALEPILAILRKPEAERSDEERGRLRARFQAEAPALLAVREDLMAAEIELRGVRGHTTLVLEELGGDKRRATHVFERGNWLVHGTKVEPGIPGVFGPGSGDTPRDRLGLARWMVGPDNPLTSRVMVNRFWEQLFGIGLVETLEDFGSQGDPPSNQALLDALSWRFQHEMGWSVKRLLREIVLSRTYRQSSHVTPGLLERDPYNRWLARGPRFRLPAETVRDQALAASGLLSDKMYGPSVMPFQPEGVWQVVYSGQQWQTSPGEDQYRRALYTYWRRTSPYPSMMAFDAPSREFCTNRRIRTNTPLAALVTLNDPVYMEAARALARRMLTEAGPAEEDRIRFGATLLLAHPPGAEDIGTLQSVRARAAAHFAAHPEATQAVADTPEWAAWTMVANVLLNLDATVTKE